MQVCVCVCVVCVCVCVCVHVRVCVCVCVCTCMCVCGGVIKRKEADKEVGLVGCVCEEEEQRKNYIFFPNS